MNSFLHYQLKRYPGKEKFRLYNSTIIKYHVGSTQPVNFI